MAGLLPSAAALVLTSRSWSLDPTTRVALANCSGRRCLSPTVGSVGRRPSLHKTLKNPYVETLACHNNTTLENAYVKTFGIPNIKHLRIPMQKQ
jgi:hypothetical protein